MIPRPSTAQLLQQCRRDLVDVVIPQVADETTAVTLEQIQMVLDVCAHRADNEIHDLVAETAEMEAFVGAALDDHPDGLPRTRASFDAALAQRPDGLRTPAIGAFHDLVAGAFSDAIEELMGMGDGRRVAEAVAWMRDVRQPREMAGTENWAMPGRG